MKNNGSFEGERRSKLALARCNYVAKFQGHDYIFDSYSDTQWFNFTDKNHTKSFLILTNLIKSTREFSLA